MLADSVKVKGFSCFKENWVGFDEFKPITVIIGRNNSGKSHLIDLVEAITKSDYSDTGNGKLIREYNGTIDQNFIRSAIEHTKQSNHPIPAFGGGGLKSKISEGLLKIDSAKFFEKYPQLNISWKTSFEGKSVITKSEPYQMESDDSELITPYLLFVKTNLDGKILRRINADRDIVPEGRQQKINAKTLFSDGKGATQIIERFTNGDIGIYPERVIQRTLLEALKFIFGKDCDFDRISIRQSRKALSNNL